MTTAEKLTTTYAECLELELSTGVRHQYIDGVAYAMAGGDPEHARLALSIGAALLRLMRGGPCRAYSSDLRVRVPATGNAYYADVTVVCGRVERDAADPSAATNPRLLVEVLSGSTERFDRGDKFAGYRRLKSLRHYVMVLVGKRQIEHYRRGDDDRWTLTIATEGMAINLPDLGGAISVDDVYEGDEPLT